VTRMLTALSAVVRSLSSSPIEELLGAFPGATTFVGSLGVAPGATTYPGTSTFAGRGGLYPGKGDSLFAGAVTPSILTGEAA